MFMDHSAIVMKTSTAMHYKVSSHKGDNHICPSFNYSNPNATIDPPIPIEDWILPVGTKSIPSPIDDPPTSTDPGTIYLYRARVCRIKNDYQILQVSTYFLCWNKGLGSRMNLNELIFPSSFT
jgi:hypothetical protein